MKEQRLIHVRIMGYPEDVEASAKLLRERFQVAEESSDYKNNRGDLNQVRRYLTIIGEKHERQS